MKITDYIDLFQKALNEYGDIKVDNLYISKDGKTKLHDNITGVEYNPQKNILSFVVDKTPKKRKLKKVDIKTIFKSTAELTKRENYILKKSNIGQQLNF